MVEFKIGMHEDSGLLKLYAEFISKLSDYRAGVEKAAREWSKNMTMSSDCARESGESNNKLKCKEIAKEVTEEVCKGLDKLIDDHLKQSNFELKPEEMPGLECFVDDFVTEITTGILPPVPPHTHEVIPPPPPPSLPSSEVLDSAGRAWHPDLHSRTKSKNADGTWRLKRGADKKLSLFDEVMQYVTQLITAQGVSFNKIKNILDHFKIENLPELADQDEKIINEVFTKLKELK